MSFNSLTFAIFLPVVFFIYWFVLSKKVKLQNTFLLVASYVFYGWWDWRFLSLIFISSLTDYCLGLLIHRTENIQIRKIFLVISILVNIGILGFFKYFNFFLDSLLTVTSSIGLHLNMNTLKIILPVGISFYTFQTLSYTIDIYKRKFHPTNDIVAFFAFVSFFPQLVAGPIERAKNLLPQFFVNRKFDIIQIKDGLRQILWGLIKKVVIADTLAIKVNTIFNSNALENTPGIILVLGSIFFTFQIYCDFSGYSDIAIGSARMLGFNLMQNFNFPFFSRDIRELWHRWHISLSTWFRDYVFIPLGGSRTTKARYTLNILLTFVISGLWHGANWTYIIWGLIHGLFYLPSLFIKKLNTKYQNIVAYNKKLPSAGELLKIILTFCVFSFSFIFFRSDSITSAFSYITNLFENWNILPKTFDYIYIKSIVSIILLSIVEWFQRKKLYALEIGNLKTHWRYLIYAIALFVFLYFGEFGFQKQFIYFQF